MTELPDLAATGVFDPRFVQPYDRRAVLLALGGEEEDIPIHIGGWLDDDASAFEAAAREEAAYRMALTEEQAADLRITVVPARRTYRAR